MKRTVVLACLLLLPCLVRADSTGRAYQAMGLKTKDVLTGTVLVSLVAPGESKQIVCLTTYLTGKKEKNDAVNVRLDVFNESSGKLVSIYSRDFGAEQGGFLGNGNLQLLDLDSDGRQEIIASFESFHDPLIKQRLAEVILYDDSGFRTAWSGPVEYDATRAARDVPRERRDRFEREFDFARTLRSRGSTLFIQKTMVAVAGEPLASPKTVQETFPLRPQR